jgi:hypothetical protein
MTYVAACHLVQVKEFEKPSTLLQDPHSMFNKLVEDTGPVASAMLRQMAAAGPQDGHHPEPGSSSSRGPSSGGGERSSDNGPESRSSLALPMHPAVSH